MKKKALIWVFVFSAFVLVNTTAFAQEVLLPEDLQISGDFAFYSKYVWRGFVLDISGHVGYNEGHFIEGTGGDITMAAGFNIPLMKTLTMTPTLCYSVPYGDLEDEQDGGQDKKAYGGVVMGYSF
ncbi:MAG: hypothetical protein ACMUIU_15650 [bacterium]